MKKLTRSGLIMGLVLAAFLAFEVANFATTEYAFLDLFGEVAIFGFPFATWLAVAFCGIDLGGLSRLLAPGAFDGRRIKSWAVFLFLAWGLGAAVNALLTWWTLSVWILGRAQDIPAAMAGNLTWIPVLVAVGIFILRTLLITTVSTLGGGELVLPSLPGTMRARYGT